MTPRKSPGGTARARAPPVRPGAVGRPRRRRRGRGPSRRAHAPSGLEFLQRTHRLGGVRRRVQGHVADKRLAEGGGGQTAHVETGVGERCRDPGSFARLVRALDAHSVQGRALGKARLLAPRCAAPTIGVTKATPFPGRSGARRAMTNSRLALPSASALSFSASPPGRSSMVTAHVSTRVTLSAMVSSSARGGPLSAWSAGTHQSG